MNKIDYNLGILQRLVQGSINGKPYVMLDDAEYVIKNSGVIEEEPKCTPIKATIEDVIDKRPAKWPKHYDDISVSNYREWFIKGTNVKIACDYFDNELGEQCYYKLVGEGYDTMDCCDTEEELLNDLEDILMNNELSWQYNT